jgi:hypothetical protein
MKNIVKYTISQVVVIIELNMFSYSSLEQSIHKQNEQSVMNHNDRINFLLKHIL